MEIITGAQKRRAATTQSFRTETKVRKQKQNSVNPGEEERHDRAAREIAQMRQRHDGTQNCPKMKWVKEPGAGTRMKHADCDTREK